MKDTQAIVREPDFFNLFGDGLLEETACLSDVSFTQAVLQRWAEPLEQTPGDSLLICLVELKNSLLLPGNEHAHIIHFGW